MAALTELSVRSPLMRVELIARADLDSALRDWEQLFAVDEVATPFNSAAWARAWIEHWDPAAELRLMRVWDGDRVAGIVPLTLERRYGARVLSMLGKEPGDYWDVVAASADRVQVALAAGAELVKRRAEWDAGVISCLPKGSNTAAALDEAGLRVHYRRPVKSPAIALPATFDDYLAQLPRSHRANLRRHLRRLDAGELTLRNVTATEQVRETMRTWRALRSEQWRARGRALNPIHHEERFHRFLSEVAVRLAGSGHAVVTEVTHEGEVIAVYLNFADAHSFYWYLGGFKPSAAGLGPGKLVIADTIRRSINDGRHHYDFTRGADAYKYWYGAADRLLTSAVIGNGAPRSRVALGAAQLLTGYRDRRTPDE